MRSRKTWRALVTCTLRRNVESTERCDINSPVCVCASTLPPHDDNDDDDDETTLFLINPRDMTITHAAQHVEVTTGDN